jgi:tetratricopeptide (TPR) repeat protein
LLEFAARQVAGHRLLLAGTYRDVEAGDRLRRVAATAEVTRLEGLETAEIGELMAEITGEPAAAEIAAGMQERTGGNPLFVRELTRLLQARRPGAGPWHGAANLDSVREVIGRRLARLSQSCIRMLTVAALDGPTLRPWLLARVLGDDAGLPALIEEAVTARVAVTEGDRTRPRFAHDLFREVLAAELPVPARRDVHRDLATALEAARADGAVVHPAELAAHFAAAATAGDAAACEPAVRFSREAAADAARRLAFEDAVAHLERALVVLEPTRPGPAARLGLLLEVADARRLAGHLRDAATTYGDAFSAASQLGESQIAARAAIGLHQAGVKTGPSAERDHHAAVLASAIDATGDHPGPLAARLNAALARTLYHSLEAGQMARAARIAEHAVELAQGCGDAEATAETLLALHDVCWHPGHAKQRLEMLGRLEVASGQDRLRHLVQLLRAQALVELGDPRALSEVDAYCSAADRNGDPVSRWQSLSRRAAVELLAGRLDAAAEQAERAAQLAGLLGDADAVWISDIQRWELARFTSGRGGYRRHRPGSPPPVETWAPWRALILADAGDTAGATAALAGFTASQAWGPGVSAGYDLWFPAIAAEAAARCGASGLQAGLYELLAPHAGTQVGCGAWVAYCGAVDYYLGLLAAAQGHDAAAAAHFDAATVQHLRLGAPLWAELSGRQRHRLGQQPGRAAAGRFQPAGAVWSIAFGGVETHVPDSKGLHDIAVLLARPGQPVPASELAGTVAPSRGEPALDRRAIAAYRARLRDLDDDIAEAEAGHDLERATRARLERDALTSELTRSMGRGGRPRRLGDDTEKARKTVTARIHRALRVLDVHHPALAAHLRDALHTGTTCSYHPGHPIDWQR